MFHVVLVILLLLLLGALPTWPYSQSWGYVPSSTLAVVLIVVFVVLMLRDDRRIP